MLHLPTQHSGLVGHERLSQPAGPLDFPARFLTPEARSEQASLAVGASGLLEVR